MLESGFSSKTELRKGSHPLFRHQGILIAEECLKLRASGGINGFSHRTDMTEFCTCILVPSLSNYES